MRPAKTLGQPLRSRIASQIEQRNIVACSCRQLCILVVHWRPTGDFRDSVRKHSVTTPRKSAKLPLTECHRIAKRWTGLTGVIAQTIWQMGLSDALPPVPVPSVGCSVGTLNPRGGTTCPPTSRYRTFVQAYLR